MDLATIVGLVGAFGMVIFTAISTAGSILGLTRLLNLPSFALVVLGSYFAVMVANKWSTSLSVFGAIKRTFSVPTFNEQAIVQKLVAFSEKARREGLLALEEELEDLDDEFMKKGLRLVVDGTDATIIRDLMELELSQMQVRHNVLQGMLMTWAGAAPAFGMMGTVVGLVNMLSNLEDKSSIGPNMAMALITTLYGSLIANVTVAPWSTKLRGQSMNESAIKELVIEGVLSIQAGDNTRILAMKLMAYLEPALRKTLEAELLKD
ncbi:MAG: MotA/TolQ/ExbB proton channel family protein [Treponema sp.]|nr:MotA/TolQ/ExbB proton channel family protein [Treponema sp.]MCL2271391.1 MotA/TolQ/ExbB proton channel family protein [Treponema sp.]